MPGLPPGSLEQSPGLRIGEIAKRSGFSVKTIRFYCDQGLLHPIGRSDGGYRLFSHEAIQDIAIIRALRTIDVPIIELGRILEVRRAGMCNCSILKESISAKIISIEERIDELAAMKVELSRLLEHWQDCGGKTIEASSP